MSYASFNSTQKVGPEDLTLTGDLWGSTSSGAAGLFRSSQGHSKPVKHLGSRALYVGATCLAPLTTAADAVVGVVSGVVNLVTCGCSPELNKKTFKYLGATNHLLSLPFHSLIEVINPRVGCIEESPQQFILGRVAGRIGGLAKRFAKSDNEGIRGFAERQIASRLTYALLAVGCVVSRVAEFAIGLVAVPLAILGAPVTLLFRDAKDSKFNEYHGKISGVAYKGLQVTGIVKDIFFCATKIINPRAGDQPYVSQSYEEV